MDEFQELYCTDWVTVSPMIGQRKATASSRCKQAHHPLRGGGDSPAGCTTLPSRDRSVPTQLPALSPPDTVLESSSGENSGSGTSSGPGPDTNQAGFKSGHPPAWLAPERGVGGKVSSDWRWLWWRAGGGSCGNGGHALVFSPSGSPVTVCGGSAKSPFLFLVGAAAVVARG